MYASRAPIRKYDDDNIIIIIMIIANLLQADEQKQLTETTRTPCIQ